jgi:hypothetical protein
MTGASPDGHQLHHQLRLDLGRLRVVREQRVTTTDGRVWYVRRRWAKRQLPWKRQPDHELSPAERDTVPILPDIDDAIGPLGGLFSVDPEVGVLVAIALLALGALAVVAAVGAVVRWVVPFMVANAVWIGLALAVSAALVLVDRWTRPVVYRGRVGAPIPPATSHLARTRVVAKPTGVSSGGRGRRRGPN